MLTNHFFQNIPDFRNLLLHQLLGRLNCGGHAAEFQLIEDERLEEFQGHQLGQAALMQFQGRAHHNDRTARVVDTLTQQVLTKTAALTFDHVRKRLQGTLVRARHGLAATTVIKQ